MNNSINCTKCGKPIPADTPQSDTGDYYCVECGKAALLEEIKESEEYYGIEIVQQP